MIAEATRGQPVAAREWYATAVRCYLEEHQGCPCCGERHCVFRARWGSRTEYHCSECDFSVAHDEIHEEYTAEIGPGTPGIVPAVLEVIRRTRPSDMGLRRA